MKVDKNYDPKRVFTREEKEQMEINKIKLYYLQDGLCHVCGKKLDPGLYDAAHIIPKKEYCIKSYGWEILNHILNFKATCRYTCNDPVMISPATRPFDADEHIKRIKEAIENETTN